MPIHAHLLICMLHYLVRQFFREANYIKILINSRHSAMLSLRVSQVFLIWNVYCSIALYMILIYFVCHVVHEQGHCLSHGPSE